MNGVTPMPKTKALLADQGATADQWFIHTPICCPSRSELVTGRYFHNLKQTGWINVTVCLCRMVFLASTKHVCTARQTYMDVCRDL